MNRRFTIDLSLVGVAALAAIAWPGFVLIGLFLGIVPGIFAAGPFLVARFEGGRSNGVT
jgi:hypothetical protein